MGSTGKGDAQGDRAALSFITRPGNDGGAGHPAWARDARVLVPPPAGNAQQGTVTARRFPFGVMGSSGDELLSAVDVVGRAGERGVGHDVDGERGDVGGTDDAADGERRAQLVPALLELVSEQRG